MAHSLFITHWYPSESKPVNGTFIREHALAVSIYDKVTLIHVEGVNQAHPKILKEQDSNITVFRLRYPKPALPKSGWLYRLRGVQQIFGQLRLDQSLPNIIHAQIFSSADLAYYFSRLYHLPAILTEQASSYPRNLFTRMQRITIPFYMNRLQMILPVSDELRRHMERYGIKGPYHVIPNTVNVDLFHPPSPGWQTSSNKKCILMVAMLYPVKGINFLLQAFQKVVLSEQKVELLIVGDGPERNSLESITNELAIQEYVTFLGVKTKAEIAELMRHASMFVLTSNWDNMPSVLIEAMACGLPIVASAIGGIPEVVKPFCGRLVEPGNPTSIAEGIEYLLNNPGEFIPEKIAQYAREEFGYNAIGKKISDVYANVLEAYKS